MKDDSSRFRSFGRSMPPPPFNPYEPPQDLDQPHEDLPLSAAEVRQRLQLPAYGQMMGGVLGMLACIAIFIVAVLGQPPQLSATWLVRLEEVLLPCLLVISLMLIHGVMIAGALAMLRVRRYLLARGSAVVTVAFLGGMCGVGLPFGIWALIVMTDRRVREAFERNASGREGNG